VVLSAKGMEQKGKGAANASVTSWLEPAGEGASVVKMRADISLTGAAAQLSRGLMPEVSRKLTQQFADCLEQTLAASNVPTASGRHESAAPEAPASAASVPAPATPMAKPVGGIGLGLSAIWAIVKNLFRRLFGGSRSA
jgi:uncharacterized protein